MFVLKILMDFKEFPTFEIKESENFGKLRVLSPELSAESRTFLIYPF